MSDFHWSADPRWQDPFEFGPQQLNVDDADQGVAPLHEDLVNAVMEQLGQEWTTSPLARG